MNWERVLYVASVAVAVLGFAWLLVKTPKKRRSNAQYRQEPRARMTLVKPTRETHFYTPTDKGAA